MGNGRFTINDIIISSQLNYSSVMSFEMFGEEGQHGYANVVLEVDETLEAARVGSVQGSNVDICLKDGTILLKGVCKSAGMSNQGGYNRAQLTVVTMSYKADEKKADLVFQDPAKMLSDIVDKVMTPCGIKVSYEKDMAISHVVYQQNETPWQFVKRLAAQYGKSVYADFRQAEISIGTVGFLTYEEEILEALESEGKNIDELRLVQSNQNSLAASYGFASQSYRSHTLDAGVGDKCGREIIVASRLISEGGILVNHLSVKKSKNAAPSYVQQAGSSFYSGIMSGTVTAVDGNRIQVKFAAHGKLGGGSTWVPYESAISNSFYCMPDIGDEVFIYYENNGKIICLGSKRKSDSHPDYDKPDEKVLTSYDKMIKFTKTGLHMTATRELLDAQSEQSISIKMDDKEGIVIESGKPIVIDAGENLLMKAGKKTVKQNEELLKKGREKFAARDQAGAAEYAADSGMSAGEQLGKSILTGLSGFGNDVADSFIEGVQGLVFYDIWGGGPDSEQEPEEEEIFETGVLSFYGMEGLILNVGESTISLGIEVNFSTPDFRWLGYEQGEHAKEELPLQDWWETALDGLQLALDVAGFIPVVGDALDVVNAGISLARGD